MPQQDGRLDGFSRTSGPAAVVAAEQTALCVRDLTVRYRAVQALRDVSLTVPVDGCIGVTGANGAGKSTLLRAIMGLVPLAEGKIEFMGSDLGRRPTEERARIGLSLVPEGRGTIPSLTVQDNLLVGGFTRRTGLTGELAQVYDMLPLLHRLRDRRAGYLSGGELQLLAIGRAMMARPRMILIDEPSMGLAPSAIDAVLAALTALRRSGISMLLVEQNVRLVFELADFAYVLEAGGLTFTGPPSEMPLPDSIQGRYARRAEV